MPTKAPSGQLFQNYITPNESQQMHVTIFLLHIQFNIHVWPASIHTSVNWPALTLQETDQYPLQCDKQNWSPVNCKIFSDWSIFSAVYNWLWYWSQQNVRKPFVIFNVISWLIITLSATRFCWIRLWESYVLFMYYVGEL